MIGLLARVWIWYETAIEWLEDKVDAIEDRVWEIQRKRGKR